MNNNMTIREMMTAARVLKKQGERFTLLGVGPMSKTLLTAALSLAKERDFPLMLIASRNQVDSDEFGHGYVCGWDQDRFVKDVEAAAAAVGFDGLVYLCRDHGGPWQRDEERAAGLPVEEAMEICLRSYKHDMDSGFDLLHIDPNKDPHIKGTVPLELVLDRTAALIGELERYRKEKGLPEIGYEAGTEETNGGLTSVGAFSDFVDRLVALMENKGLQPPEFVVGQTGTLTRLTENVGHFNRENARKLSENAEKHGVGIKEHNGDYLSDAVLLEHLPLGVTAMNVAPEFGVVETRAWLTLAQVEAQHVDAGRRSDLTARMTEQAVGCERWRKWMVGDTASMPVADALKDAALSAQITDICGHYTYEIPDVREAMDVLRRNLASLGIAADAYVASKIKASLDRYAYCFGLYGLTGKLRRINSGEK